MDPGYLVFGNMWLGTKPTTYTSSVAFLSFLYKFAIETSRAPVKRVVQLKSAFVVCLKLNLSFMVSILNN